MTSLRLVLLVTIAAAGPAATSSASPGGGGPGPGGGAPSPGGGGPGDRASPGWITVDRVIAVVNHDALMASDVDRRVATFREGLEAEADPDERERLRAQIRGQVLEALIDEQVVLQQATRAGVTASDDEIDRTIATLMQQNQLDEAAFTATLEANGYTMARYREELGRQLRHIKMIQLVVAPQVPAGDEEALGAATRAWVAELRAASHIEVRR
jgi:parvulin-like peptidyl-prolyl isomerase